MNLIGVNLQDFVEGYTSRPALWKIRNRETSSCRLLCLREQVRFVWIRIPGDRLDIGL